MPEPIELSRLTNAALGDAGSRTGKYPFTSIFTTDGEICAAKACNSALRSPNSRLEDNGLRSSEEGPCASNPELRKEEKRTDRQMTIRSRTLPRMEDRTASSL